MKKFYLDVIIFVIFMLTMSFHFIPKILHEILGLLMMLLVFLHFKWNVNAFKSLYGNLKKRISMIIDVALLLCMLIITFTGICISHHLFNGMINMQLQRNILIHQLHVLLPYVFIILSGIHLGLHWKGFWQRIKNLLHLDSNLRFFKFTCRLLVVILIIIGIYGSFMNRIGDRLLMEHIFATAAIDLPFGAFLMLLIGIFSIYVFIGKIFDDYFKK